MNSIETLPDWGHIEQLQTHLWCDREFGKAAIMVGAGFSLNAKRKSPKTPPFPIWHKLAELMYDSLYLPKNPTDQDHETKIKATSGGGVLKLSSEYEAYFGRQALDKFIEEAIPDNSYSPGELHKLLLSLPWSDVFTTNYDTLLEQTTPLIHDRKYDHVLTPSDIPGKMKPRIVKLHGSFPSHRPFIITEEDYRTYPAKFAPFVNMVRQSMMENTFCLIGFSGDDPNFLHWVGWVRDNLGTDTARIYLCGILNLSPPQRRVLEGRGVIPIDLSPLVSEFDCPDPDIRYEKALKKFLETLKGGAPPDVMAWPTHSDLGELPPDHTPLQTEELEKLHETWRKKRQEYPGWVVAPLANRGGLWRYTERWIKPVLHSIEELPPPENLFLSYELNWRLETALIPLFMDWVEKITPIIETFNPYPGLVEVEDAAIRPDNDKYKQLDWKSIEKCWVELVFALAREAREDQDESRFRFWMDRLEKVVKQHTEWQARWFYEECLFHLFRFDQEKIRKVIEDWPETSDLPFWEVKRASILAELGELKEAEKIAEEALFEIRSSLQHCSIDYSLLSQEGWAMLLLEAIKSNKLGETEDFVKQCRDRWEQLRTYRCNPFPEIERLELVLNGTRPSPKPETETKKEFDPDRITVTHYIRSGWKFSETLPAFAFLRMLEAGAVPMKCGAVSMFSVAVVNSAKWVESFTPLWSLSSMIRAGEGEELKKWFDRVHIATLTQDEVDRLNRIFIDSLTQARRHLDENPEQINFAGTGFSQRQVILISEMLSRLCFRLSTEQLIQLFDLTLDMYKQPIFRQHYILHSCVDNLFKRILYTMPQSEILHRIPELLSLPILNEMGFKVSMPRMWGEPFNHIKWLEDTKLDAGFDRSAWSAPIANLVGVVNKDGVHYEARKRAATRLGKLYEIDGLTTEESETFGKALWSKINLDKDLPSATGFYDFAFLNLPETGVGVAKEKFRRYLLSKDFPRVVQRSTTPDGKQSKKCSPVGILPSDYIQEWLGGTVTPFPKNKEEKQRFVDWTTEEVTQLLKKALNWWNDEKAELQDNFIADTIREQFLGLVELMADVILPRLADANKETKALAGRLLSDMEQSGLCVLSALPMTLFINPNSYDEITRKLRYGLNSTKEVEVRDYTFGIFRWLVYGGRQYIPTPPDDLLNELVNRVVTRRQPGLDSAIRCVSDIVRRLPELLDENQIESLCVALDYLIKDTELPERHDREAISRVCLTIPINDRPESRKLAAELAYRLFSQFTSKNEEVPQILIEWKEICQDDPLPEVRRVWRRDLLL